MTEIEFIQVGKETLDKMRGNFDYDAYNSVIPKFADMHFYMASNPNNIYVQCFISELIELYVKLFLNEGLIEALSISDSEYFFRKIQIYKSLLYTSHPEYAWSLFNLFNIPSFPKYYESFKYLLEKYKPHYLDNKYLQAIFSFAEENKTIMRGGKDTYYSLIDEIRFYKQAQDPIMFDALKDFLEAEQRHDSYSARNAFRNKRIGNIGEMHAFDIVEDAVYKSIVARDVKNGFGYDIYFSDENNQENLIEVKTTTRDIDDDFFSLSENEYKIMRECLERENANYYLCRVILDSECNPKKYSILSMQDSVTFVDIQDERVQYKLYPFIGRNVCFRMYSPEASVKR